LSLPHDLVLPADRHKTSKQLWDWLQHLHRCYLTEHVQRLAWAVNELTMDPSKETGLQYVLRADNLLARLSACPGQRDDEIDRVVAMIRGLPHGDINWIGMSKYEVQFDETTTVSNLLKALCEYEYEMQLDGTAAGPLAAGSELQQDGVAAAAAPAAAAVMVGCSRGVLQQQHRRVVGCRRRVRRQQQQHAQVVGCSRGLQQQQEQVVGCGRRLWQQQHQQQVLGCSKGLASRSVKLPRPQQLVATRPSYTRKAPASTAARLVTAWTLAGPRNGTRQEAMVAGLAAAVAVTVTVQHMW
jgi:hypothetical protein